MAKKFTSFSLLLFCCLLSCSNLFSQKCLSSVKKNEAIKNHPEVREQIQQINEFTEQWIAESNNQVRPRAVETVPVVVHVIWKDAQENISEEQINSQIEVLNQDFRKMNANFSSTPMPFQSIAADVEIEFCLAKIDPDGNASTGITRTQTTVSGIGNTESYFKTAQGGIDAWDISKYLNIWVCNLGNDGLLGFATPPGTAIPPESDGVVIAPQFFGTTGMAANSFPNHLGRTATHEMGHYFNLEHVWGPTDGGCGEDDFVDDTPSQETESSECPTFPLTDNCTSSGNGIMFNNYLDYSDDECMTMFTQGQKMRMLAALNGPRKTLLSTAACASMTPTFDTENDYGINVYPNPSRGELNIELPESLEGTKLKFVLVNLLGEKIMEFSFDTKSQLSLSSLPAGIFILKSENLPGFTEKILVSK